MCTLYLVYIHIQVFTGTDWHKTANKPVIHRTPDICCFSSKDNGTYVFSESYDQQLSDFDFQGVFFSNCIFVKCTQRVHSPQRFLWRLRRRQISGISIHWHKMVQQSLAKASRLAASCVCTAPCHVGAHVKCNFEILPQVFLEQVLLNFLNRFSWSVGCRADYLALKVQNINKIHVMLVNSNRGLGRRAS